MNIPRKLLTVSTVFLFVTVIMLGVWVSKLSASNPQGTRKFSPEGFEFGTTTPALKYHLPCAKYKGTTFKATWIAENVEEVRPNLEIDAAEVKPGTQPVLFFDLSKPKGDWPKGQYRLEIRADGVLVHTEKFLIQ